MSWLLSSTWPETGGASSSMAGAFSSSSLSLSLIIWILFLFLESSYLDRALALFVFFWTEQEAWYSLPPCWDIVGVSVYKAEDVAHHGVDCHDHGVAAGAQELLEEEILHCGRENLEQAALETLKFQLLTCWLWSSLSGMTWSRYFWCAPYHDPPETEQLTDLGDRRHLWHLPLSCFIIQLPLHAHLELEASMAALK